MVMKLVLFLDDCNGFESNDPLAWLVKIPNVITLKILDALERTQHNALRFGGNWKYIMRDGEIKHEEISNGRKSDYIEDDYDIVYKVASGNY